MPPTGDPTRHGPDSSPAGIEALEAFFAGGGEAEFELEHSVGDLVVLVGAERQHGTVGGLPGQDGSLRVTLVFRRPIALPYGFCTDLAQRLNRWALRTFTPS
jgi:hypothetical protein